MNERYRNTKYKDEAFQKHNRIDKKKTADKK